MGQRSRPKKLQEADMGRPMLPLRSSSSSDDDEEANRDLSLEIVERARRRQEEEEGRKRAFEAAERRTPSAVYLPSLDELDAFSERRDGGAGVSEGPPVVEGSRKKAKKRKKKQRKEAEEEAAVRGGTETADLAMVEDEEELIETTDSIVTEANDDISDNIVLRKLLRGPRYFDPGSTQLGSCYNCGVEGHTAAACSAEKRKKPCFVCGLFGHNANKCSQGQDCFICKRRGHSAKNCPDKHKNTSSGSKICLRCGDLGHDMPSCRNDYPPDDLKNIQCYVCKSFGHFCCVSFVDAAPRGVSCYNCGDSGHSSVGCAKPRGQSSDAISHTLCYVCGEEGHFARGCSRKSKSDWRQRSSEPPTPATAFKKKKDAAGSKSLPHNFAKGYKKRSLESEGARSRSAGKSKVKGGWMVDYPRDLPTRIREVKPSRSPRTPRTHVETSYKCYRTARNSYNCHPY